MKLILTVAFICCQVAAAAQDPPDDPEKDRPHGALRQNVVKLLHSFRGLSDWDMHRELMLDSVEKVYARNGWDSESDAFSLSLIREVNQIPPWSPQERFDKVVEIISDRYLLDQEQEVLLRRTMIREVVGTFQRHSGRIAQYAVEAVQTRAAGEAFTPEQVARWVQLATPVLDDARRRANQAAQELKSQFDPEQRELLDADLAAANRRMDDVHRMSRAWARGEWQPSDWGMEEDPIQLAGEARRTARGEGEQPAKNRPDSVPTVGRTAGGASPGAGGERRPARPAARPAPPAPNDHDPWAQYVHRFILKYHLDQAQQARAWKIYRDVRTRGDKYRKRFGEQIEAARRRVASADNQSTRAALDKIEAQQGAALERLFQQLRRRLERLPTRTQWKTADPLPLEPPVKIVKPPPGPAETGGP